MLAEAAELEAHRKEERVRRRKLVSSFVTRAEELLANPDAFRAAPASVSAAIARAVDVSRREFGADLIAESTGAMPTATPGVIIRIEGGDEYEDEMIPLPK